MSNSQECLAFALEKLENDPAIDSLICSMFQDLEASDMANYWIDFMSMVEVLMMNVHAVHTCNWEEYLILLREMMPWLVVYDQTNYARWTWALVDMGMMWHLASPTAEERVKSDGSPYTWGDYTNKIGSLILARHVNATTIICINDPYDYAESIKIMSVNCVFKAKVPYPMYI